MEFIQIGSIPLLLEHFYLFLSMISSLLAVFLWGRLKSGKTPLFFNDLARGYIHAFIFWKLSPIIFSFFSVWENPLSLLFFIGGSKGLVLAGIYLCIFVLLLLRKNGKILELLAWTIIGVTTTISFSIWPLIQKGQITQFFILTMLLFLYFIWTFSEENSKQIVFKAAVIHIAGIVISPYYSIPSLGTGLHVYFLLSYIIIFLASSLNLNTVIEEWKWR
ncbi:hypothetical protein ACFFJY_16545 [Fictibacillus aquaticus]|uniref:Uncharacterized protein n=1 Tax=Fictibacillus aquaticus TaxID=2021314 RepID=A0A235F8A8_9BACL|nr:hypothetical protein [Fictibacillus aquaticus]OYD56915.1 hypothetical protein CGZ90_15295 [Fictibacillus aquaticus]